MRRVMITGANRGIGLAFAKHYAEQGAQVFATCRTPDQADNLHRLAEQYHVHVVQLDVSQANSIEAAKAAVMRETDGLDLLINNAAVFPRTPFEAMDFETSMNTLRVNAVAPMMVTKAFFELGKQLLPRAR